MPRYLWSVAFAVSIFAMPSLAQRGGGHNGFPVLAPSSPHNGFAPGRGRHQPFPASFYLGTPFWADDFYSNGEQAPQVYVIQAPPAPQQRSAFEEPKPIVPVMIELQGDRYVRHATGEVSNSQSGSASVASSATGAVSSKASAAMSASPTPVDGPPSVFVFRDGHREESSDYSIISGVIYSRGDYWSSGSWSKQILIADLDLPATMQANRERGVRFRLPNAPNEVITRP
jgi:hypothetical protein